jgi:hypothetical protein
LATLSNSEKQWQGKYWGKDGALLEGTIAFLSLLYSAAKSAPTKRHKLAIGIGIWVIYRVVRSAYEPGDLSAGQADVLASVASKLGHRDFAIRLREFALKEAPADSTSRMLLLAGLMRDWETMRPLQECNQEGGRYFVLLRGEYRHATYLPREQKIRILRALAWFAARNGSEAEIRRYVRDAHELAERLGAEDQLRAIRDEFVPFL